MIILTHTQTGTDQNARTKYGSKYFGKLYTQTQTLPIFKGIQPIRILFQRMFTRVTDVPVNLNKYTIHRWHGIMRCGQKCSNNGTHASCIPFPNTDMNQFPTMGDLVPGPQSQRIAPLTHGQLFVLHISWINNTKHEASSAFHISSPFRLILNRKNRESSRPPPNWWNFCWSDCKHLYVIAK